MSNSPWTSWTRKFRSLASQPIVYLSIILSLFSLSHSVRAAAQTTNFAIGTTAQRTGVKHLGINISSEDNYDSAQMMKNLLYQNPGFEGESWQSILNCVVTSPTTCQDADIWGDWPANFLQGATFQFIYGAANGQTGTIASNTASNYAGKAGVILTFSAPLSPAPAAGDYLVVKMNVPGNAQVDWQTSTSGGASISTDTTDIASDSPGKQALSISAAASGQSAQISQGFDTTSGRSFVQLTGTYTFAFKAKGTGGNNQLNVSITRLGTSHGNETFLNQNVTLTNQWQDYSYTFNANEDGTYIGPVLTTFSLGGASVYLDDVSLTPAATAENPSPFRDEVVARLKSLQPGVLRYMNSSMLGSTIDNLLAVPFARQRSGFDESTTEQTGIGIGIPEFLALCQTVGAEPWINVPSMLSPTEMQDLIQYLAGAASTPYGAIRAAQGQSAPWTSVFPVIHLELGNEMWNGGAFYGQIMLNSTAYGNRAATIFAAARATPGYNPSSFDLVLSTQAVNPGETTSVMAASSGYDSVDAAPYLFYSLNDTSSNENIFAPMFAQPEQVDSTSSGYMAQQAQAAASGNTPANLDVYEVNLSTISGEAASQTTINQVDAGIGSGIAVADHMLLMIRDDGIMTQNMFALPGWINGYNPSGTVPLWGSVIDMGGQTNLSRPTFLAEELANSAILPTMLSVTTTGSNPTWNETGTTPNDSANQIQLPTAHYLQPFAFTNGTQHSVVVMNLSRSGSLPVTFSGANAPTGNVLISQLTSANITDNNDGLTSDTPVVNTTQTNVSSFNPATPYSLPPFSMTVFSWPGSSVPAPDPPTPAPVTPTPAPVTPTPAPVTPTPAPVTPTPAPVTPTPAPVTPTPAPVTPTPAPVTPTPAPVTPTPAPVTPTPAPVTPTPAPVTPTPAPVTPTPAPVTPTPAPVTPTPTPVTPTPAPVTPTPTPVTPTPAPVTPTPAPVTPTPAPVTPTPAPVTPTPAPVTPTPAPVTPTPTPVTPTPTPVTPTPTPVTPTPAPVTPTPTPVTPTPAPVTPAPAPVTPTPAPVTPTPAPVTPTPAPVTPTPAPVTPTPAPVTPTPAPVTPTPAPVTPTPAPVTPTPAPVTPTPAPVTPTPAPVTPTPAPVTPTPAPVTPTPAPVTPTPAPVTPTPAPVTPTPAPVTPTPAPVTPTPAPVTPTPAPVVGSTGTPGYTMTVSKSDVTVSKGEVANLMVTLTPVNGFKLPVNLTCSGLPVGTTCNFTPPTVTPNGAPASSTLSILVGSSPAAAAQNRLPGGSSGGMVAFGLAMPWGLFSLLGLSKRKNRSRMAGWPIRLMVTAALIAGSLWMSGCGYSTNGSVFTMTLTGAGQNVPTQTSQVTVSIAP